MYQVNLLNSARKGLKKLDKRLQEKVIISLRLLETNPFLGEKMSGNFQGSYGIKFYPVRIIYSVDLKNRIILIKAIGYRQGIYKN